MSGKKLYTVKDDKGQYWDFTGIEGGFWYLYNSDSPATSNKDLAFKVAKEHGGHVVTFVEESEKVVLTEKQAKIVEDANDYPYPTRYIFDYADYYSGIDVELLIKP